MTDSGKPSATDDLVLAVFLHGFKGGADTFAAFPTRLQNTLTARGIAFEPVVYPPYDTRGELIVAVDNHVTWLTNLVAERTAKYREAGGKGAVRVILFGHSMGGLVISDTLLKTISTASIPILGLVAYDSPLLGLNPAVFKSTFDKALDYASKGQAALAALGAGYGFFRSATTSSSTDSASSSRNGPPGPASASSGSKSASKSSKSSKEVSVPPPAESASATPGSNWLSLPYLAAAGITGAAAAAFGAAYYNRDTLAQHWTWATSHLSFVGELWKQEELEQRLEMVVAAKEKGIGFHNFYTLIPAKGTVPDRTFLILPHSAALRAHFSPAADTLASDEIHAHMDMFDKSDGMYRLSQETAALVQDWVDKARRGEMGYWKGEPVPGAAATGAGEGGEARKV
ncbi:A/B superfamily hydrolase [Rhodotorula taiwanensis]|uniref:A/B superfamily hydrolase n=1 Tax=Rhodotorula taiwanensis TaxID=741276 RepID=A0A2S5BGY3_9BASI|nr:A/B superfamily hydrolase [Rhodotorula taiwanensis]